MAGKAIFVILKNKMKVMAFQHIINHVITKLEGLHRRHHGVLKLLGRTYSGIQKTMRQISP